MARDALWLPKVARRRVARPFSWWPQNPNSIAFEKRDTRGSTVEIRSTCAAPVREFPVFVPVTSTTKTGVRTAFPLSESMPEGWGAAPCSRNLLNCARMFGFALAVLLETRFLSLDAGLSTSAQASPRPEACREAASGEGGMWLRLRGADVQHYCELLARGYARLAETPEAALRAAEAAEQLAPGLPAVQVLRGRALLRLSRAPGAYQQFVLAEASDARAFVDPKALHDYARAASLAEQGVHAVRLYRLLVARAALLDDPRERAFCQIEAASQVLAYTQNGTDEALGYLAQTRAQSLGLLPWIDGLRWLAIERGGHASQLALPSASASAAALGAVPPPAAFHEDAPMLPPGQFEALRNALSVREGAHSGSAPGKGRGR